MPAADKARFLANFKREFEPEAAKIRLEQRKGSMIGETLQGIGPANFIDRQAEKIFNYQGPESPLDEYTKGNKSAYNLLKENPFYDPDSSIWKQAIKRTAFRTISAIQNTSIGAVEFAASKLSSGAGMINKDLQKGVDNVRGSLLDAYGFAEEMQRADSKFSGADKEAFKVIAANPFTGEAGEISVTHDDLYSLVGQVAETYLTGGLASSLKLARTAGQMTVKESLKIGAAQAGKQIAAKQGAGAVTRAAIQAKEATKSLWVNSAKVGKAESILATSLQGSFGSAGQAVTQAYGEYLFQGLIPRYKMKLFTEAFKRNTEIYKDKYWDDQDMEKFCRQRS